MAFTVKNYMARGVNLENAYFKINQFSGSKTGGYSAQFGVYVSKSIADENISNIIDHITIHCDYEENIDPWNLMYSKAKTLSIFTGKDVQDC